MKSLLVALSFAIAGVSLGLAPLDADAKRLGGGRPAGMQRQAPAQPAQTSPPATPAQQPTNAAAAAPGATGAAAAAGKRSWMGPVAGLAAGLGLAALASHFGFGEGLANMMTMLLIAAAAFFVIRWLMRRFGPQQGANRGLSMAGAGAGAGSAGGAFPARSDPSMAPLQRTASDAVAPVGTTTGGTAGAVSSAAPEGFDAQDFERIAKMIFIRLQAANDAGQIDDLRKFTTPELFASLRLDLQERGTASQQTDVLQLDAQVEETTRENDQWIVSVRFRGLIREQADAGGTPFEEVWHLVKPVDGSREWAIAGITPKL